VVPDRRPKLVSAKPPPSAPKLKLEPRHCAEQQCSECGINLLLPLTCPNDNRVDVRVAVRVFEVVPRTTADPHRWKCRWDLHNRRLVLDTFEADTLVIMTDFSANFDCDPSARLNSATSEHALLDVFLVHHSPSYTARWLPCTVQVPEELSAPSAAGSQVPAEVRPRDLTNGEL